LECWKIARRHVFSHLKCEELKFWLSKDKTTPKRVEASVGESEIARKFILCEFCGEYIEVNDINRYHVANLCGRIAGDAIDVLPPKKLSAFQRAEKYYKLFKCRKQGLNIARRSYNSSNIGVVNGAGLGLDRGAVSADSEVT
jgi:hypothetical protein